MSCERSGAFFSIRPVQATEKGAVFEIWGIAHPKKSRVANVTDERKMASIAHSPRLIDLREKQLHKPHRWSLVINCFIPLAGTT